MKWRNALVSTPAILPRAFESSELTGITESPHSGIRRRGRSGAERGGQRNRSAGVASCTLGTSGVVFAQTSRASLRSAGPRPHFLPRGARSMARDGRDAGRGAELCNGSGTVGYDRSYDQLTEEASASPAGANG